MSSAPRAKARPIRTSQRRRRWALLATIVAATAIAVVVIWQVASRGDQEPPESALGSGTRMGAVELLTGDLESLQTFYEEGVGLTTLDQSENTVSLGIDEELIRLVASDDGADDRSQAGLYHSAFLFPSEAALAQAIAATVTVAPESFQGSSDHRVSQAFYFADPDGNGVELYVDRPADEWLWEDGLVVMGSAALEPNAFLAAHLDTSVHDGPVMGHVHLRGGSVEQAEAFYADVLGFAVTSRADGAVFFAADGYHHHLAVNVWSSGGAGERSPSLGLGAVTIHVADNSELDALEQRLTDSGTAYERDGARVTVADPWGTRVEVVVAG